MSEICVHQNWEMEPRLQFPTFFHPKTISLLCQRWQSTCAEFVANKWPPHPLFTAQFPRLKDIFFISNKWNCAVFNSAIYMCFLSLEQSNYPPHILDYDLFLEQPTKSTTNGADADSHVTHFVNGEKTLNFLHVFLSSKLGKHTNWNITV